MLSALLALPATPALAEAPSGAATPTPGPDASAAPPPGASAAPPPSASAAPPPSASAAPRATPAASSTTSATAPLPIINGAAARLQPFGPGVSVTVQSSKLVRLFVAHAPPDGSVPPVWDFTPVGTAPLTFELPPGRYVVSVENDDISRADHLLRVGNQPVTLDVSPGSSGIGGVGTLMLGVGILSVLAATVVLISGSNAPAGIDKPKLVIPMYAAGGGLLVGGLTMYLVSRTSIKERPGPLPAPPPRSRMGLGLRASWAF